MNDTLIYFLKVNIAIVLFYLSYRLFFTGDTFWKTRRYYLLFSILISFTYPFLSIENWMEKQETVKIIVQNYTMLPELTVTPVQQTSVFSMENILLAVYGLGVLVLLVRMLVQLISILRLRLKGQKQDVQGVSVIALEKEITPFSFFNTVFMNPTLHTEHETREILAHELTHVRQGHSFDVLLSELLTIGFWFNPTTWLLKREIRQNLEFLADDKVLESGFDSKAYQYHLLQLSYQTPEVKLGNKFNVAPLKKRIIMMNQQKTNKAGLLKYSLVVPLALALILSSNAQTVVNKAKKVLAPAQKVATETVKKGDPKQVKTTVKFTAPVIKKVDEPDDKKVNAEEEPVSKTKVYDVVEKMPEYPGGINELMNYLIRNIKYPVAAQEAGIEGKVFVRFIVNAAGNIEKSEVLKSDISKATTENVKAIEQVVVVGYAKKETTSTEKSAATALEQEALRVVNAMSQWTPGEQKGEKVTVNYVLPINFKLESGKTNKSSKGIDPKNPSVIIVDGKTMAESFNINSIDVNSIASINVLKPNSELQKVEYISKYGAGAINGVIIIETKK